MTGMHSGLNEDTFEAVELLRWGMRAGMLNSVVSYSDCHQCAVQTSDARKIVMR